MEGYCAQCQRWFDIELPDLDAGLLCPNCLARAGVVRAKKRVAHGRRLRTGLRRPVAPPAAPRKPDIS
jgi:DNA-directed RNA polymerase subunit RPC12/RpoP